MSFFVSFADSVRSPRGDEARAAVIPERGVFFVVEGAGLAAFSNSVDHALRTSTRSDDVAEVLDGLHEELRARATPASFALVIVEEDALGFFGAGSALACLVHSGVTRTTIEPRDEHVLGGAGENPVRFFRAYVRAGTVVVLASRGAHQNRERAQPPINSLQRHADYLVEGPRSLAPAAAVVVRVDEEPRIR